MSRSCLVMYLLYNVILCVSNVKKLKYDIPFIGDCELPEEKYAPITIKHYAHVAYVKAKPVLQLNFTVEDKTLPVLHTIRLFKLVQKRKQLDYTVANLTCTNPVTSLVGKKLHLKYDDNCRLLPGIIRVSFSLDDLIKRQHNAGTWDMDHSLYDYEFHTKSGVLMCIAIQIDML